MNQLKTPIVLEFLTKKFEKGLNSICPLKLIYIHKTIMNMLVLSKYVYKGKHF